MEREMWVSGRVEVDTRGFFTTHHRLEAEAGELGELVMPAFGSGGVFHAAGGWELEVERTSWWRGQHELRQDGIVVGTACPGSFWGRRTSVGFRGQAYELEPAGWLSGGWNLVDEAGGVVMRVDRRGIFRGGAYVRVLGRVPVDLVVFTYYLAHVRWQEQAAAAAAASSAAAGS